jgi:hypothetical protein
MSRPNEDKKREDWKWTYNKDVVSPILFNLYSECLPTKVLEGFGDFKIRGQVIHMTCAWPGDTGGGINGATGHDS